MRDDLCVSHEPELAALIRARELLAASDYQNRQAYEDVHQAERRLAAVRGEPWAEQLDLAAGWDIGAPMPHVVSNGTRTDVICYAAAPDPSWDGTYATVVHPGDEHDQPLMQLTFHCCQSIRFGGPNDEALNGHPFFGRGLAAYQAPPCPQLAVDRGGGGNQLGAPQSSGWLV